MKIAGWCGLLGVAATAIAWREAPPKEWIVLVSGHTAGYLAPCGCSSPMVGGIKRRASALRQLRQTDQTLSLEAPGLVDGSTRQDSIKAETLAEAFRAMDIDAVGIGAKDAQLNNLPGAMALAKGRFVFGGSAPGPDDSWKQQLQKGPFSVTATSDQSDVVQEKLGGAPSDPPKSNVVLFDGDHKSARKYATEHPEVRLLVYQSEGEAAEKPLVVNRAWLVSPGDRSRNVLRLRYLNGKWTGYQVVSLDPSYKDDPAVDRLYRIYLKRVDQSGLLDRWPKRASDAFVGSDRCLSCHAEAGKVWKNSAHHHALATLEAKGHERDPDCVRCHVTGLDFQSGFRSRIATPDLANVGCESCHGPGGGHSATPTKVKFVNIRENACLPCHTNDNSPGFTFLTYWPRIRHGLGITGGKISPH